MTKKLKKAVKWEGVMFILSRFLKQYKIPWVGGFKDVVAQLIFYVSIVNFTLIVVTAYNTTLRDFILQWLPGFKLWMFFAILIIILFGLMVLEYKFIVPSLYSFRGKQMFEHQSKVMDELIKTQKALKRIEKRLGIDEKLKNKGKHKK